jgi:hypothetical protein
MLEAIGVGTVDDLFADVPTKLEGDLNLPPALSEYEALRDVAREVALSDDAEFAACLWEARREFTLLGFLRPSPPAWRGPEAGDLLVLRWNLDDGVLADVAQPRLRGFGAGVELDRPYRDAEEWLRVASRPGGPLRPLPGRERALEPWAWL